MIDVKKMLAEENLTIPLIAKKLGLEERTILQYALTNQFPKRNAQMLGIDLSKYEVNSKSELMPKPKTIVKYFRYTPEQEKIIKKDFKKVSTVVAKLLKYYCDLRSKHTNKEIEQIKINANTENADTTDLLTFMMRSQRWIM